MSLHRFMLNGVEIDLGLTDDDSMPARVEALRIYLEDHLGFDSFVKVYQLMEGVSQDDDEVRGMGIELVAQIVLAVAEMTGHGLAWVHPWSHSLD